MLKRFMTMAVILVLTLGCVLPVNTAIAAESEIIKCKVDPFMAIGMSLKDFEARQGKGEYKYTTNSKGKFLTGVTYKLDWSNLLGVKGELETEYALSKKDEMNIVTEITLKFPEKVDRNELIDKLREVLGTPETEKSNVKWYQEGVLYELQGFGKDIKINMKVEKFNGKKHNLSEDLIVLARHTADVNGDGKKESVILLGERLNEDSLYMDNIYLLVEQSNGKEYVVCLSKEGGAYLPSIKLCDFTGDKVPEVMVSLPTGGSGGIINYYIYSLKDNKPVMIFDSDKTSVKIEGVFAENYKGKIHVKDDKGMYDITALIDLKEKKDVYEELGIYKDGKIVKDMYHELMPNSLYSFIKSIDIYGYGVMGLEAYQSVKGSCNADFVANIVTIWKWENGEWDLVRVAVEK